MADDEPQRPRTAEHPEVTAARISRGGTLGAALIGVAGTVVVALVPLVLTGVVPLPGAPEPAPGGPQGERRQSVAATPGATALEAATPAPEPADAPGPATILLEDPDGRVGVVDLDTATTAGVLDAEWVAIAAGGSSPFDVAYSAAGYCADVDVCIEDGLSFAAPGAWSSAASAPADQAACSAAADAAATWNVNEGELAVGDVVCLRTDTGATARVVVRAMEDLSVTLSVETW